MEGEKSDCTWYTWKNDKAISYLENSFSTCKHIQSGPRFANFIRFEDRAKSSRTRRVKCEETLRRSKSIFYN